jgi:hypothetical protein
MPEVSMARTRSSIVPVLGVLVLAASGAATAQANSADAKIVNALSSAPPSIGDSATIMDWAETPGAQPTQLRAGTNGWVCFPDMPATQGNDPMCLDEVWLSWANAWMGHTQPKVERLGIGYMIAPGGGHGSNTDPYATGPTPDNEWGYDPPHLMILVPDLAALEGLPTSRDQGGPWVMWKGTPYAHIMAPVPAQEQNSSPRE